MFNPFIEKVGERSDQPEQYVPVEDEKPIRGRY